MENKNDAMEWLYNIAGDIAIRPVCHLLRHPFICSFSLTVSVSHPITTSTLLFTPFPSHIQNSHLPFSTRDMPKKGDGPMDTFKKMLEEVTGVTESGAEGIADQWRSFRTLMEGFEKLERRKARGEVSQKDVEGMLSGCVVCLLLLCGISLLIIA